MKPTIHGLFSTPIYISKLERKFTDKENKFISESKIKVNKNLGNTTTNNNYK